MKLYYNANFYSLDENNKIYQAVLVEKERIKLCFEQCPVFPGVDRINLHGATVFPGFTDSHTHSFEGGLYSLGANLQKATSLQEVFALIEKSPTIGNYKFAFGFDENKIKEKRFPTMNELDKVVADNPLLLRRVDGHSCVINSKAMSIINFPQPVPANFSGFLNKEYNDLAAHTFHNSLPDEAIKQAYDQADKIAGISGLTTVHTMVGDAQYSFNHFPFLQANLDKFTTNFIPYPQFFDVDKALEYGSPRIGGCILADGSFGSHTAGLFEVYNDKQNSHGQLYQEDRFWEDFVWKAHKNNLQIGVHCIGDRAIAQVVKAYVKAQQKEPKDLNHQIIHNELMNDESLYLMNKYKIAAVMQPMFDKLWGGDNQFYSQVLGVDRALKTNRFKTIYDAGILLAGSSDWYITSLNILDQLQAVISHHNHNERLSVSEALKIYTVNSAKLAGIDDKGMISPGFVADFSILEKDPFKTENFIDNRVLGRVIAGDLSYV